MQLLPQEVKDHDLQNASEAVLLLWAIKNQVLQGKCLTFQFDIKFMMFHQTED